MAATLLLYTTMNSHCDYGMFMLLSRHLSLSTLVLNSRDQHEKMATEF